MRKAPRDAAFRRELATEVERLRECLGAARIAELSPMHVSNGALFAISTLIWGSTWLAITYQLGVVAPEVSVAYRFALAALIARGVVSRDRRVAALSARASIAILAAFGATLFGLNYVGVYWAERFVASGLVAVVFSTIVFMNPIGMRIVYGEPLTLRMLVAATLGVTGVALLFLPELDAARHGGAAAARRRARVRRDRDRHRGQPHRRAQPQGRLADVSRDGVGHGLRRADRRARRDGHRRAVDLRSAPQATCCRSSISRCSAASFAFGAYLTLLKRVGAGPASFVGVATPVLALVLSTLFEGYRWTWLGAVGVVLAVAGNWLALRAKPR